MFDLQAEAVSRCSWTVALPLDDRPWHVGLIVGPSGCGNSTIARRLWPDTDAAADFPWPTGRSLLNAFPAQMSVKDVVALLSSVGFSSPPCWLRSYGVLCPSARSSAWPWLVSWRSSRPLPSLTSSPASWTAL